MWPADFVLPAYANRLSALIEALELGPAHVASLGGALDIAEVPVHCHDLRDVRPANEARPAPHPPSRHASVPHGVGSAGRVAPKGVSDARSGR